MWTVIVFAFADRHNGFTDTQALKLLYWRTTSLVEGEKSVKISGESEVFASESTITNIR